MAARPEFIEQLQNQWVEGKLVCIGLDADVAKLPPHLKNDARQINPRGNRRSQLTQKFLSEIVDATAGVALAYKPNIAFFEDAPDGERALERTVDYIHSRYPQIPVIGDVKRADIGATNGGYAKMAFDRYGFDAITTNPWFGHDTYPPFTEHEGKGLIVLGKTSNPGAGLYQDAPVDVYQYQREQILNGTPLSADEMDVALLTADTYYSEAERLAAQREKEGSLTKEHLIFLDTHKPGGHTLPEYQLVILRTGTLAKKNPNIGAVIGATHPEAFAPARMLAPEMTYLIPGIGKQGGDLEKTLLYAPTKDGTGIIINNGSNIIFNSNGRDFAKKAGEAALNMHERIVYIQKNK